MLSHGFIILFMCLLFYFLSLSINQDIFINYLTIPPFYTFFVNIHFSSRRDGYGCIIRDSYRAGNLLSLGYAHL